MQHQQFGGLALAIILISACAGAPVAPSATPQSAQAPLATALRASPTSAAGRGPVVEGGPDATPLPGDSALSSFTTPEGYYGIGRSDAPNLIVMYSDVF
jgi:hypothetical protein